MTDEELARRHWDDFVGLGMIDDDVPQEACDALREQYVINVLGRPHVVRELRQLYEGQDRADFGVGRLTLPAGRGPLDEETLAQGPARRSESTPVSTQRRLGEGPGRGLAWPAMTMLDPNDPRPYFQQVAHLLRAQILTGELQPGEKLPSLRELSERYGVAAMTIQQAQKLLRHEGLTVGRAGSGVYVRDRTQDSRRNAEHNHAPHCCCHLELDQGPCPACPMHGDPGCFFHGVEPIPEGGAYRVCLECGHCWPTAADLEADVRRNSGRIVRAGDVSFCPLCAHDF